MDEVGDFWESVIKINSWQQNRIYKIIVEKLYGNLANKKIAIFGFAFKANTNDTRESPAINICNDLLREGAFYLYMIQKLSQMLFCKLNC